MKKRTLLLLAASLTTAAFGQPGYEKVKVIADNKHQSFENIRDFNGENNRNELQSHSTNRILRFSQSESASRIKEELESRLFETWDKSINQWVNKNKIEYTFDNNENMCLYFQSTWDKNVSQWVFSNKVEFTYNANGNNTLQFWYAWDKTANNWFDSSKREYTFDVNGNITMKILYSKSINQWIPDDKDEYIYDMSGKTMAYNNFLWDAINNQWMQNSKEEYIYNVNGTLSAISYYDWNQTSGNWIILSKEEYIYDSNGIMTARISNDWDGTTGMWVPVYKDESTLDVNGNRTIYLTYNWDATASQWVPYYKSEYLYDNSYSLDDLIIPYYYDKIDFRHLQTQEIDYYADGSNWLLTARFSYNYSLQIINSVFDNNTTNCINIYPNPASDFITIKFNETSNNLIFELYNLQGKKIMSQKLIYDNLISLKNLNKGLYIYKLKNINGTTNTGKLLKQ